MRIDSHQHYWDPNKFHYFWMTEKTPELLRKVYMPADLKPIYEQNRIDGSVLVQASHTIEETWWSLELADQEKTLLGVVAWVDLTGKDLGHVLDRAQKYKKFKGIRHLVQDEPDDNWLLRPAVIEGLKELARRKIPFDLCIHPRHLPLVPTVADKAPDLRMVVDHLAKPFIARQELEPWSADIAAVARYPQIYCKLSGMITEARADWTAADLVPYATHCFYVFGANHCMFGSDWPVCLLAGSWKQVLAAFTQALGAREVGLREKLMGLTTQEFYRL